MTKGYIFDYGGTLDTGGLHWGKVLWHAYVRHSVAVTEEQFRDAYVYAERYLGSNRVITPNYTFKDTLDAKLSLELEHLNDTKALNLRQNELEQLKETLLEDVYTNVIHETAKSRKIISFYGFLLIFLMLVKKRIENMKYNAKYATAFKLGMMFNKDIAPNAEPIAMSVKNQDDILCAIKKAYLDMSPRTLQNNDSLSQNHEINKNGKEELFKSLAERFSVYMEKGADDFDEWHYKTCEFFREEFKNLLKKANKDPSGST